MTLRHLVVAGLCLLGGACASSTPEQLAADLQNALQAGDIDATLALAELDGAPPEVLYFYADMVPDCYGATRCTVELAPYDEDRAAKDRANEVEQGFSSPYPPIGLLVVKSESQDGSGEQRSKVKLPYAKIGSEHRIVAGRFSEAKLAELRATSTQTLVDRMLERGVRDPATGEPRTDWKTVATVLPAGGGEVGAWFKQHTEQMYRLGKAGDLEGVIAAGGRWEAMLYGDKEFDGTPRPRELRLLKLRTNVLRSLASLDVLGGYQYGDDTVLVIEGRSDNGWVVRGPIMISGTPEERGVSARGTISHPPQ